MSHQLAVSMTNPRSDTAIEANNFSTWLIQRYASNAESLDEQQISTLKLLRNLYIMFNAYSGKNYEKVLEVVRRIKLVPLDEDEVPYYVNSFQAIPDEVTFLIVRENIWIWIV